MKISKSDAVRIFVEVLDIAGAKDWDDKKLNTKITALNEDGVVTKDDLKKVDKKLAELTKKVVAALNDDQTVEVAADPAPAKKGKDKDEKPAKKGKGKPAKDEDEDDEESEDEDDEESEDEDEGDSEDEDEGDSEDEDDDEEEEEKPVKKGKKDDKGKDKKAAAKGGKDDKKPAKKKESSVERDEWGVKLGTRTARINAALNDKPKTMAELQQLAKATGISSHLSKLKELKLIKKTDEGYVRTKEGMKGYDAARAKKLLKG